SRADGRADCTVTQDELKRLVAEAALAHVPPGTVIGVGSGSTVNLFIDALARLERERRIAGAVSSSAASTARLVSHGIAVVDADGLAIADPVALETEVNQWPGVICVGIFARRRATVCLLATAEGVRTLTF